MKPDRLFAMVFLLLVLPPVIAIAQEPPVVKFDSAFSLMVSAKYNFINYSPGLEDDKFESNRPLDIGIGFGCKELPFDVSVFIPLVYNREYTKTRSFDFNTTYYYQDSIYFDGYTKYYDGFHHELEKTNQMNTKIFLSGISGEYIFNNQHSIRSAYNLDRKQTVSNGSFLLGGGIYFSSIDEYNNSTEYHHKQKTFYFGPNFGYSHNLILGNNFFANVIIILGINATTTEGNHNFNLHASPKVSFGYHGQTWSTNLCIKYDAFLYLKKSRNEYNLYPGSVSLNFAKRF